MRGIYKITNTNNGKCYIGKSENLSNRIRYHITSLRNGSNKNKHMQNAYNYYGENTFTIEIIEVLKNEDNIDEREKYWIKKYNATDRNFGYNRTDGGDGGNSYFSLLTKEQQEKLRQKQSVRMSGEGNPQYHKHVFNNGKIIKYITDNEINEYTANGWVPGVPEATREKERNNSLGSKNSFYGKKHSQQTKDKISSKRSGKNNWNYGKTIVHKDNKQKYVSLNELDQYLNNGWNKGISPEIKKKIGMSNKGRKTGRHSDNVNVYIYKNMSFYGWREMKKYLNNNGYPTISEQSIIKISKGIHVRGYDELDGMIRVA